MGALARIAMGWPQGRSDRSAPCGRGLEADVAGSRRPFRQGKPDLGQVPFFRWHVCYAGMLGNGIRRRGNKEAARAQIARMVMMVRLISIAAMMMPEIQGQVAEQHMVVRVMADKQMFDLVHRTGDRGLGEDKRQGDAKHRSGFLEHGAAFGSHGINLAWVIPVGNPASGFAQRVGVVMSHPEPPSNHIDRS